MNRRAFEAVVRNALDDLPPRFRYALENVAIMIEEEPSADEAGELQDGDHELFGLYIGVPLTEREMGYAGVPDRVIIYRGPILRSCATTREIAREVRDTLIHELGHHMGLSDDEMPY